MIVTRYCVILMLPAFVLTSVILEVDFVVVYMVCGFDEFVPVDDCEWGEVADGALDEDCLFDALIRGVPPVGSGGTLSIRMLESFCWHSL